MIEITFSKLHELVLQEQNLLELEYYKFYPLQKKIFIETPTGEARITEFVRKHGKRCVVKFSDESETTCIDAHQFIGTEGDRRKLENLIIGDEVQCADGLVRIISIERFEDDIDVFDVTVDSEDHLFKTADGLFHHNTGKTQTVEDVLAANGLSDGKGYFKITGSASPIGIYNALYKNRDDIILFDDADGALESQDGRNIIKAATDTKKIRKIAWAKKSAGMYDPGSEAEQAKADSKAKKVGGEDLEAEDELDDDPDDRIPNYFNYTGQIIFISNLPLNKLDPDGALRTRAFIISIDPTPDEIIERMEQILGTIKLEGDGKLSDKQRLEVLNVIKAGRRKDQASLRTLVRALNLAASGAPNWARLVSLYA